MLCTVGRTLVVRLFVHRVPGTHVALYGQTFVGERAPLKQCRVKGRRLAAYTTSYNLWGDGELHPKTFGVCVLACCCTCCVSTCRVNSCCACAAACSQSRLCTQHTFFARLKAQLREIRAVYWWRTGIKQTRVKAGLNCGGVNRWPRLRRHPRWY